MTPLSVLKRIGGPGSLGFLVLAAGLGLLIVRIWPRWRTFGRAYLLMLAGGYALLSLPVVAQQIAAPFLAARRSVGPFDFLVLLDGDNRWGRVQEATRLWRSEHPKVVIVSGDVWLASRLLEAGVPEDRLIRDWRATTTREQVEYVARAMTARPDARVAIVASRLQMPRIAALTYRARLRADLYPSPVDDEPADRGGLAYVPSYSALRVSRDALYERMALVYYRWRGWIEQ